MMSGPPTRAYNLRLTEEQLDDLTEKAAAANLTVRAYILLKTLDVHDVPDFRYKANRDRKRPQDTLPMQTEGLRMTG